MSNNSSKQILLSVIGVAILVIAVVGVSFAFFSYVYNGEEANTIDTGTIVFTASDTNFNLTNQFPQDAYNADKATISISGSTTYEAGIDFQVRVTDVANAGTIIPRVKVTAKTVEGVTINVNSAEYNKTNALANGVIASGTIAAGTGVTAETAILEIQAYYAKEDYHISDNTLDQLSAAGLLSSSYAGTIVGTDEWNALTNNGNAYSFKIQVLATQANSGRLPA